MSAPEPTCPVCDGSGSSAGRTPKRPETIGWSPCRACGGSGKLSSEGPASAKSRAALEAVIAATHRHMAMTAEPRPEPMSEERRRQLDTAVRIHGPVDYYRSKCHGCMLAEALAEIDRLRSDFEAAQRINDATTEETT